MEDEAKSVTGKQWAKRIVLNIPHGQLKKLKKGQSCVVLRDGQMYELKAKRVIMLNGAKLTKAKLLALLKQF